MEYVARFSQQHESFRLAELQALASVEGVELEVVSYSADVCFSIHLDYVPMLISFCARTYLHQQTPFCVVRLSNEDAARALIRRSILAQSIGELWGDSSDTHVSSSPSKEIVCLEPSLTSAAPSDNTASGSVVAALHESVRQRSAHLWPTYGSPETSFRIDVDSFQGSRTNHERLALFEGLSFLGLRGPIRMKNPDVVFTILEHWAYDPPPQGKRITEETKRSAASAEPQRMYFVRHVAASSRHLVREYSLKTRRYVSTTSMDAELALVTANLALASDGKLFYDPFAGTGGFPIACAAFGATVFGSDIDGRAVRGTGSWGGGTERERGSKKRSVKGNFDQYGLTDRLGDLWVADLTNTPLVVGDVLDDGTGIIGADDRPILRRGRRPLFDGIACDPPYGVREGLRVLGFRDKKEDRETTDLWT